MGRRPKTKAEMQLSGADGKHPERMERFKSEPKPHGPLGPPPERFFRTGSDVAERQLQAWNELVQMAPPGVLTSADRWWCERAACLMARSRYEGLKASEENALANYLTKMACNPADRSKVNLVAGAGASVSRSDTGGDSTGYSNTFKAIAEEAAGSRPN